MLIYKCINGGQIKAENSDEKRVCYNTSCRCLMENGKCGNLDTIEDDAEFEEKQLQGNIKPKEDNADTV